MDVFIDRLCGFHLLDPTAYNSWKLQLDRPVSAKKDITRLVALYTYHKIISRAEAFEVK